MARPVAVRLNNALSRAGVVIVFESKNGKTKTFRKFVPDFKYVQKTASAEVELFLRNDLTGFKYFLLKMCLLFIGVKLDLKA